VVPLEECLRLVGARSCRTTGIEKHRAEEMMHSKEASNQIDDTGIVLCARVKNLEQARFDAETSYAAQPAR
jgi:hypothetical protein